MLKRWTIIGAGLVTAAFIVAFYRSFTFSLVGDVFRGGLVTAGAVLWAMLAAAIVIFAPLYLLIGRGRDRINSAEVVVPVFGPAFLVAFLAARGPASRVGLALLTAVVATLVVLLALRATRVGADLGNRLMAMATLTLLAGVLLVVLFPAGESTDLDGLADWEGVSVEPRQNIVVLGVDGLDWQIFEALSAQDRLPNLARLRQAGAAAPLHTIQPTSSPFIWNSIYTGFSPAVHQRRPIHYVVTPKTFVGSFPSDYVDPTDAILRFLKPTTRHPHAVWDVLAAAGYETAVLGAWEQEPVPEFGESFLTRTFEFDPAADADEVPAADDRYVWSRGEATAALDAAIVSPRAIPASEWRSILGEEFEIDALLDAPFHPADPDFAVESRLARLRAVYASDRMRFQMGQHAIEHLAAPFFVLTYIRGVDVMQHSYTHQLRGVETVGEPRDVVFQYYELVDRWIGELVASLPSHTTLVVVSDHGIDVDLERVLEFEIYKTGHHDYAPHGFFLVHGPALDPTTIDSTHVFDVAPTLIALAGLPNLVSSEGRVLREVSVPTLLVQDWRDLESVLMDMNNPQMLDPDLVRDLRALGYIR